MREERSGPRGEGVDVGVGAVGVVGVFGAAAGLVGGLGSRWP
jgi:hypothetical protein